MAQVSIKDFDWNKDYYAFVCIGGYECYAGRFRAWKLYSLTSDSVKTLSQRPEEVKALFETEEELNAYMTDLYREPAPEPEKKQEYDLFNPPPSEVQVKTIGSGKDKLVISSIL